MNFVAPKANEPNLIGIGLYTASEAERLIHVPSERIRRWLLGHNYHHNGQRCWSEPLWQPQVPRIGKEVELGFRDLLELRFVNGFTEAGLGLKTIRKALQVAQEMTGASHPFATARFQTDGRSIFLRTASELDAAEEPVLIDLLKRQYALNRMIAPSLKDVEFDTEGLAARWWPGGRDRSVVLDPTRQFGRPIVAQTGTPTRALAEAISVEGSVEQVAHLFELPIRAVRDAVAFEKRLAA